MNTVLIVCAILATIAVLVGVVFLISTLIQARRIANEAEVLLKSINKEVSIVTSITEDVQSLVKHFGSPWFKVGALITGLSSLLIKKKLCNKKAVKEA